MKLRKLEKILFGCEMAGFALAILLTNAKINKKVPAVTAYTPYILLTTAGLVAGNITTRRIREYREDNEYQKQS